MSSLTCLLDWGPSRNDVINSVLYYFVPAYRPDSDSFPIYAIYFPYLMVGSLHVRKAVL